MISFLQKISRGSRLLCFYLATSLIWQPALAQVVPTTPLPTTTNLQTASPQNAQGNRNTVQSLTDTANNPLNFTNPQALMPLQMDKMIKVHVLGEVANPGVYTVTLSDRLSDVINLASPKRPSQRLVQLRHEGDRTQLIDLYRYFRNGNVNHNPYLRENDVIFVPPAKGAIRVEGPVNAPGIYELYYEKNLQDALGLAGEMTSAASQIHPIKVIRFSEEGKKFVLDVGNTRSARRSFKIHKGDIIIVPDIVNSPKKFDYSVESIPGENLFYPTSTPNVFVVGAVNQAGSYPYKSHLRVKDYVAYAGPNPQARMQKVTLIRDSKRKRFSFDDKPQPGDILVVKSRLSTGTIIASVSTAMSLALTALLLEASLKDRF